MLVPSVETNRNSLGLPLSEVSPNKKADIGALKGPANPVGAILKIVALWFPEEYAH
jgi:hypothetical protein